MGILFGWFIAPKKTYGLVITDFGVLSAKKTLKGYSEEHRMIKFNEFLSLSERKTISGRFSIDETKEFEGVEKLQQKQR